jgi:hypothetical protein
MAPGWRQELDAAEYDFLNDHLGPDILGDAKRLVPIDTGRLWASLDFKVAAYASGWELQVGSFADEDGPVEYAAAVELGFHGEESVREFVAHRDGIAYVVRAHIRRGNSPEQPYLRPALWTERY